MISSARRRRGKPRRSGRQEPLRPRVVVEEQERDAKVIVGGRRVRLELQRSTGVPQRLVVAAGSRFAEARVVEEAGVVGIESDAATVFVQGLLQAAHLLQVQRESLAAPPS